MTENGRIRYIDTARGIGMICIILGHLGNSSIDRVVYTFHVPLFFIIAGYFLSEKKSTIQFIKNRARNLLVPYAVTCIVMIIIAVLEGIAMYGLVGAWQGLNWVRAALFGSGSSYEVLFYVRGIGAIWFLLAMFWSSAAVKLSLKMNRWVRIVFIAALFGAGYFTRNLIWLPLSFQPGLCAALFVYIGWLMKHYSDRLRRIPGWLKIAMLILAAAVWGVFIWKYKSFWLVSCNFGRGLPDMLMCLCACAEVMFIAGMLDKVPGLGGLFAWIGRYSLIILCIHNIELNFFPWTYTAQLLEDRGMPGVIVTLLIIAVKIAADMFFAWLLLKIRPVRKFFCY